MLRFTAALAICWCLALQAAPHRPRIYPNSLTIFSMTEGPDGMLWLAAEDGLYRFDGFHYHKITSIPFTSARYVGFTGDGALWVANFEGLARLRNHRFETLLTDDVAGMAVYPDRVFVRAQKGIAEVRLDGSVRRLLNPARRDLAIDSKGVLWFACQLTAGCSYDPAHPDQSQTLLFPPTTLYQQVVHDSLDRFWAADPESAMLTDHGRPVLTLKRLRSLKTDRPGPLLEGRNGQLWFLGETVQGLVEKINFRDRSDYDRFPPVSGIEDQRGHLWVSRQGLGLVEWTPDTKWQRWFPEDVDKEVPVQVTRDLAGVPIVATQKSIFRQDTASGAWFRVTKKPYRFYAILPIENGEFLASIFELGLARFSAQGDLVEQVTSPVPEADQYRQILRDRKGRLWVGSKRSLMRIQGRPGSLHLRDEKLPDLQSNEKAQGVDLEIDANGRLWVGYMKGLAWLDDQDQWHKIKTSQPVTMIRSFALDGDNIWVAYRRTGPFSRLHRSGDVWNVTLFPPNSGYGPTGTELIKRDSRGWIWRGTSQGVFVSDAMHVAPNDWIHLDLSRGLAAQEIAQYGFFEEASNSVWLTGDEGFSRLEPDPAWFNAPRTEPPQVTRIEADGRSYLYPEPLPSALPTSTKVLRVDIGGLNAPPFRSSPLRYRLLPVIKQWQLSSDGSLEFRNLPDDDYTLEISYTGNGHSPIVKYPLRVGAGTSAIWRRWWFVTLLALAVLAAIIRYAPGLDRLRFRIEKAAFLLRSRFRNRDVQGPASGTAAVDDRSGETLNGRYYLSRILSRGGFSVVYEARDLKNGNSRLALKILNRDSGQPGWIRDRFAHEVAALGSVSHPGVVSILDSWISRAGEPCLVMPFLDGQTLRAAMDESPFPPAYAARIIRQLGSALGEVHGRGIVHRDLKPENLILVARGRADERAVIIDFGTAGLRTAENELAATTLMSGSFHYMAPERLTGRYSPASDVFSLGVIILEILTAKRLANLSSIYTDSTFNSELENALPRALSQETRQKLAAWLAQAYDPDPKRRPADVAAWTSEIASLIE